MPMVLLFGFGLSLVVAPLTSTLMSSVPVGNAGLASAINNSISRVGQPLLAAVIFVVVSGSFYASLAADVPGVDPNDPQLRAQVQPLNPPAEGTPPDVAQAATEASVDALHLAVDRVRGAARGGGAGQRHRAAVAPDDEEAEPGRPEREQPAVDGARGRWLSRASCASRTTGTAPRTTASPTR